MHQSLSSFTCFNDNFYLIHPWIPSGSTIKLKFPEIFPVIRSVYLIKSVLAVLLISKVLNHVLFQGSIYHNKFNIKKLRVLVKLSVHSELSILNGNWAHLNMQGHISTASKDSLIWTCEKLFSNIFPASLLCFLTESKIPKFRNIITLLDVMLA